jgi:DNA mismatch repair protein MutS2
VNDLRENLSEETIPMRAGRLVLKLQAGSRGRAKGLIHGRSASGRSFYFEPFDVVEDNNHLQQIGEEEAAEKRRIMAELVKKLREHISDLRRHGNLVAELDHLQALVRFAEACGGRMADLTSRHELRLVAARHPLLDPRLAEEREKALGTHGHRGDVVPLDLELSAGRRALVITGPNAGGKTVALKTLGLLALANQCGLPISVGKGSQLPFFKAIVATVGDDQDLLADRSTFSGRLLRLKEAWEVAGPDTLVLLDELGSGTDPEEGAALSTAVLEAFLVRETLLLITTHLSQVAATALEAESAFCAAMLFDSTTGYPTYRLLPGPPGGSEALALARRLGLPSEWTDRAEELLGTEHRDLRRLLAELEVARDEVALTHERLEQEVGDAEVLRRRLAEQESALIAERKSVGKKLRRDLEIFREETRSKLLKEVERLRDQFDGGRRKGLAAAAVERLFEEVPKVLPEVVEEAAGPLLVGGVARHHRLGWEGVLEKLDRGRAQVRVKGRVFKCREEDLRAVTVAKGSRPVTGSPSQTRRRSPSRPRVPVRELEVAPKELMLIGQRVEPALESLDQFLDQALLGDFGAVRIVHGHGSGRLRTAVRDHLRHHPAVQQQRPGAPNEGGDGATVVELEGG